MDCLRCNKTMTQMDNNGVEIDVCLNGCGGIWFDQYEFKKLDESHESDPSVIERISKSTVKKPSSEARLNCPKCDDFTMMRHFFSTHRVVEIDVCGGCAGVWLDGGEILEIYKTCPNDEAKKEAFEKMFNKSFKGELDALAKDSIANLEKAKSFKSALRFICPSFYLGKD